MKKIISYILILLACKGYGQQNMILNGDFESTPTSGCQAENPVNVSGGSLVGLSASNFNNNVNVWRVALHNNDASDINSDEHGEALLIDRTQCGNGSLFNNNIHSCSSFPAITFSGTKFALVAATYIHCGSGIHPFKRTHGAIGVSLQNGGTFDNGITYVIRYKLVAMGGTSFFTGDPFCAADGNGGLLSHIRFFLSENPPATWNDNSSDQQELYGVSYQEQLTEISGSNLTPCAWRQEEREFTANQGNYTTLVIYCESGGAAIDDVEIFEKCEATKTIQNKVYPINNYGYAGMGFNQNEQAGTDLLAGHNVNTGMPQGDVIIASDSKANFTAGNSISLQDGFIAEPYSEFAAVPLGCPNSLNRTTHSEVNQNPDPDYIPAPPMKRDQELTMQKQDLDKTLKTSSVIFPNPTQNTFQYTSTAISEGSRFVICNLMNQALIELTTKEATKSLHFDVSMLVPGIYFLNRYDASGKLIATHKLIKE